MSSTHTHPRRRAASPHVQIPSLEGLSISKGATFQSPKCPPSSSNDPILDISSIPRRTLTSPEGLAEALAYADERITSVLTSIDKSLEGVKGTGPTGLDDKDAFPVPRFLIAHAASSCDRMDVDVHQKQDLIRKNLATNATVHDHASDSGLGTSVSGDTDPAVDLDRQCRFCDSSEPGHADLHEVQEASKRSVHATVAVDQPVLRNRAPYQLSEYAVRKIREHIIDPILGEERLKDYHGLIGDIPHRIGDRAITCLRDLEKTLIYLAPVSTKFAHGEASLAYAFLSAKSKAKSAASYLNFAETSIQAVHTTVDYLHERDQRRPTDRPYTNNYFLDLVQQVRQYARIMAISRQKQREGKDLNNEDWTPLVAPLSSCNSSNDVLIFLYRGEKLRLKGGLATNGRPAELVREKPNGESMAIDAGKRKLPEDAFGDDAESSMARKRKCDQGKIDWQQCQECLKWFKRPCDLTKHAKTHTRPWKCPEIGCKYYELGWPTEKERDRHINDRHTSTPAMYNCIFEGCSYSSKRESNCKQHMEKTHGYQYVRSKSRKGEHLTPVSPQEQQEQFVQDHTPVSVATSPSEGSAFQAMSTPSLTFNPSPFSAAGNDFSPPGANAAFMPGDATLFPPVDTVGPLGDSRFLGTNNTMPMNTDDQDLYGYPSPSNACTDFSEEDINKTLNFRDPTLMTNPEAPDLFVNDLQPTKDWFTIDPALPREAWMEDFDTSAYAGDFPQLMMTGDQTLFPDSMGFCDPSGEKM